jgi:hypothetical protein
MLLRRAAGQAATIDAPARALQIPTMARRANPFSVPTFR